MDCVATSANVVVCRFQADIQKFLQQLMVVRRNHALHVPHSQIPEPAAHSAEIPPERYRLHHADSAYGHRPADIPSAHSVPPCPHLRSLSPASMFLFVLYPQLSPHLTNSHALAFTLYTRQHTKTQQQQKNFIKLPAEKISHKNICTKQKLLPAIYRRSFCFVFHWFCLIRFYSYISTFSVQVLQFNSYMPKFGNSTMEYSKLRIMYSVMMTKKGGNTFFITSPSLPIKPTVIAAATTLFGQIRLPSAAPAF